jgi:hypothetical protein
MRLYRKRLDVWVGVLMVLTNMIVLWMPWPVIGPSMFYVGE